MQFWKTQSPDIVVTEDLILRSVSHCPLRTESETRLKRGVKIVRGRTDRLWPYTAVSAAVMVLNSARQGPPSAVMSFHTKEDVPGAVTKLFVVERGCNHFTLSWLPPTTPNGLVLGYVVRYKPENATEDKNEELVVDMSEQVVIKIHDLISNTVYVMSVCAMTSVGHGAATSVSEVTQHPSHPDKPIISDIVSGDSYVVMAWQVTSAINANPGHTFFIRYRSTVHKVSRMCEFSKLNKNSRCHTVAYAARSVQVWLTPQSVNKPQHLCVSDFVPTPDHDSIQSLVTNVNDSIDRGQLKGQIVSVETLTVPTQSGVVDCDVTRWTECANTDIPCAFVLRVFYNREVNGRIYGSDKVHVGIMDFVPQPTDNTYEGFEDLIDRMNRWLREQRGVQVINIQSVMVQKHDGPHSETGSACFYSQPGANRPVPVDFFRILRVVYLKPIGDLLVDLPVVGPLSYESFTPELVKCKELTASQRERVEKMKETFAKVTAFLQASGTRLPLL